MEIEEGVKSMHFSQGQTWWVGFEVATYSYLRTKVLQSSLELRDTSKMMARSQPCVATFTRWRCLYYFISSHETNIE